MTTNYDHVGRLHGTPAIRSDNRGVFVPNFRKRTSDLYLSLRNALVQIVMCQQPTFSHSFEERRIFGVIDVQPYARRMVKTLVPKVVLTQAYTGESKDRSSYCPLWQQIIGTKRVQTLCRAGWWRISESWSEQSMTGRCRQAKDALR